MRAKELEAHLRVSDDGKTSALPLPTMQSYLHNEGQQLELGLEGEEDEEEKSGTIEKLN